MPLRHKDTEQHKEFLVPLCAFAPLWQKCVSPLFVIAVILSASCKKCPTTDQLQGTWIEITSSADKSKLVFQGENRMYFYHSATISLGFMTLPAPVDTFEYSLDRKHFTMFLNFPNRPSAGSISSEIEYHKKKKILNVSSLFPSINGNVSQTNYQPQ